MAERRRPKCRRSGCERRAEPGSRWCSGNCHLNAWLFDADYKHPQRRRRR